MQSHHITFFSNFAIKTSLAHALGLNSQDKLRIYTSLGLKEKTDRIILH